MKTLFISFDNDFFLHTEGNIVTLKYDLLNDLSYELGAELVYSSKITLSTDKTALITDFKKDRPVEFATFSKTLLDTVLAAIFEATSLSGQTLEIELPMAYIEWLKYHPNPEYNALGKSLFSNKQAIVNIELEDILEYVDKFMSTEVKRAIEDNSDIQKFTFVESSLVDFRYKNELSSIRENLTYETFESNWILYEVASSLYNGIGAKKDISKSFSYYERAAEKGNGIAANFLGWYYQTGNGNDENNTKAFKYYNLGVQLGNINAFANLGYCYHLGIGTSIDYELAAKFYLKSAESGITFAQVNLADLYYYGKLGEPNYQDAFKWYFKAAEGNDTNAQYKIGEMLINGKGAPSDISSGLELLKKSALGGNVNAVLMYAKEVSKISDLTAIKGAYDILDKNSKRNIPEINYLKGKLLLDYPDIYPKSATMANDELKIAKKLGYEPAIMLLKEIKRKKEEKKAAEKKLFLEKMKCLMKKAFYTKEERDFLEGKLNKKEYAGCDFYPPSKWEEQFITTDSYGVKYNHKYHRLVSAQQSAFDGDYRSHLKWTGENIPWNWEHISLYDFNEIHFEVADGSNVICKDAFINCYFIDSIKLPESLKVIGHLPSCIRSLTIPKSVKEIYLYAFNHSSSRRDICLRTLTILNGNIRVVWEGYDGRGEIPSTEKNNCTSDDLFKECKYLEKVYIPVGFKGRFEELFPSIKDKLEEMAESATPSSTKQMIKKEETKLITSDAQKESKPKTVPKGKASKETESKGSQSKKSKPIASTDNSKTKSRRKASGDPTTPQKAVKSSAKRNSSDKSRGHKSNPATSNKTKRAAKSVNLTSNINSRETTEKPSFLTKLKNIFK